MTIAQGKDFLKSVFLDGLRDIGEDVEIWEAEIEKFGKGWRATYEARVLRTRPGFEHLQRRVEWTGKKTDCFELAQGQIERFILGNTSQVWNHKNVKIGHPDRLSYYLNWRAAKRTQPKKEAAVT